jgi:hypothetical protein
MLTIIRAGAEMGLGKQGFECGFKYRVVESLTA